MKNLETNLKQLISFISSEEMEHKKGATMIFEEIRSHGLKVIVAGISKTIDNDILVPYYEGQNFEESISPNEEIVFPVSSGKPARTSSGIGDLFASISIEPSTNYGVDRL
ncbi:hypothetical protein POM88_004699 [Heracleum sosnowskyi]|uniref:Uncharacterized protein n=1 Tax=Heracleum sosnowskyi TaxID=360622 RepID=A0AAD8NCS6_9APIA|nr:hypothetical protein POM88_004699 [Heracleum sosnowskyi]